MDQIQFLLVKIAHFASKPGQRSKCSMMPFSTLRRCQMIARAKYIGRRLCDPPKDESSTSFGAQSAVAGSIAVIWLTSSITKVPCHTRNRINRNDRRAIRDSNRRHAAQPTANERTTRWKPRA